MVEKVALDDNYGLQIMAKDEKIRDLEEQNSALRWRLDSSPGWAPGGLGETSTAPGG